MTSIRIVDVEKKFGPVRALKKISLDVRPGEFFTLLGPSGCGKTTLLRTVAGFYRQDSGDIFLGEELVNDMPAYRRETGMVFQNYAVFPHMTVFENVAYGLKVRKLRGAEIRRRVEAALRSVHLEGYGDRTPDQLSGGQQQRVGLARAMVIEPRVLLLDEPLSNLDAKLRVEMRSEIREIQKHLGITALYVTHDQEEALAISDRIAVLEGGIIQQIGSPREVYESPDKLFVATFVGNMNLLEGEVLGSEGGGLLRVRTAWGELSAPAPAAAEIPKELLLGFRPEAPLLDPPPEVENLIEAPVRSQAFLGSVENLELELGGKTLLVECRQDGAAAGLAPGGRARISVAPASLLLFDPRSKDRIAAKGASA